MRRKISQARTDPDGRKWVKPWKLSTNTKDYPPPPGDTSHPQHPVVSEPYSISGSMKPSVTRWGTNSWFPWWPHVTSFVMVASAEVGVGFRPDNLFFLWVTFSSLNTFGAEAGIMSGTKWRRSDDWKKLLIFHFCWTLEWPNGRLSRVF